MILILLAYFGFISIISFCGTKSNGDSNKSFYSGNNRSNWLMVAYGMVGASVSGVSFVSVPGMVAYSDMTYLQMCFGFIPGYLAVAFILLPLYYRLKLVSIYSLLETRLGLAAHKVGAWLFIIGDMLGTAVKFFLVCVVLHQFAFDEYGVPFFVSVPILVFAIWLYTHRGGVSTLVLTDAIQTTCMIVSAILIIYDLCAQLHITSVSSLLQIISDNPYGRIFVFDNFSSTHNFWKQFVSGIFVVIVMTGLNQNMMQKNLTCRSLKSAQKNMCLSSVLFLPVNLLLLVLGVLLLVVMPQGGGDTLLPSFVNNSGLFVRSVFVLGIVAAAFSSADSSLTAMTTSLCVDVFERRHDIRLRKMVHAVACAALILLVFVIRCLQWDSLIDLVYTLVSYSYGPLLGLFALALLKSKQHVRLPYAFCAATVLVSPAIAYLLRVLVAEYLEYEFGYELLLLNALLTFIPLYIYASLFFAMRRR